MKVRSRVTTGQLARLPDPVVQDLFEVQEPGRTAYTRLVAGGTQSEPGVAFLGPPASRVECDAIARIVEPLGDSARWDDWLETVPIVAKLEEGAGLQPLEKEMESHLTHLQHVCQHPRLHLRVVEERVRVSRARRIPVRATASLVSHPEDWEHRTLRGIQPARVLSAQMEDEWDLYENRVSARLVDHLLKWTTGRAEMLRRFADMIREGRDFQDETSGSRFRAARLYTLWGRFFNDEALAREVERTLRRVEGFQRSLQALLDTSLYVRIPRGRSVPPALVPTNILVNDPHYRKVAALWRAWARYGHHKAPTRDELRKQRQEDCRNFDAFGRLIVIHALHELGFRPGPEGTFPADTGVDLRGPLGGATLKESGGSLRFSLSDRTLYIVPVLAPMAAEVAPAVWRQLDEQVEPGSDTLLLLLGRPEDLESLDPDIARSCSGWTRPKILLISAWSLDCVERVARVLGAWEAQQRFSGYPRKERAVPDPGVVLPSWLRREGPFVALLRPPLEAERADFLQCCEQRRKVLEREQAQARKARGAFDPGQLTSLEIICQLAGDAKSYFEGWTRCPVCPVESNSLEPRPDGDRWDRWTWWCRCAGCSAEWGLRTCDKNRHRFPVLIPKVSWPTEAAGASAARALDRAFGRDVWAEPRCDGSPERSFLCPICGCS